MTPPAVDVDALREAALIRDGRARWAALDALAVGLFARTYAHRYLCQPRLGWWERGADGGWTVPTNDTAIVAAMLEGLRRIDDAAEALEGGTSGSVRKQRNRIRSWCSKSMTTPRARQLLVACEPALTADLLARIAHASAPASAAPSIPPHASHDEGGSVVTDAPGAKGEQAKSVSAKDALSMPPTSHDASHAAGVAAQRLGSDGDPWEVVFY